MFRLFVFSGVLVVIALFTALVAPYFIDWTAYKQDFERQASQVFGQPVKVGGGAKVRILPLPSVTFGDLSVGKTSSGEPLMTVDQFSANVELAPLLSGEIRIVNMSLTRPHFNIEVDESGRIAWTQRRELLVDPDQVALDSLTVRGASFILSGLAGGSTITGDRIDADISAQSLIGPWRIEGSGDVAGSATAFSVSTGRLTEARTIRLKITGVREDQPYELKADGPVSLKEDVLAWEGMFEIAPVGQNGASGLRGVSASETGLPVRTRGKYRLVPAQLDLDELSVEIGSRDDPFVLSGLGTVDLRGSKGFRLQLDGRQIDVARIAQMRGSEGGATTLEERIALVRGILDEVPVPAINGVLDFEIPAIVSGDTMLREISTVVQPEGKRWKVHRLEATLPGNTILEFSGSIGTGDDFGIDGDIVVATRQPSGLAGWLAGRASPHIRRIKRAGLSGSINASPSQLDLQNLEIRLDDHLITGRINRLAPVEKLDGTLGNPAVLVRLSGDAIQLDDLRALYLLTGHDDLAAGNHDLDVAVKAGRLSGYSLRAEGVDLEFQLRSGKLSVSRLNAERFLGARFKSTGQIKNLLTDASGNLRIEVEAANLALLAAEAVSRFGDVPVVSDMAREPSLTADAQLVLEIDAGGSTGKGIASQNRYVVRGLAGGTEFDMHGGFDGGLNTFARDGFALTLKAVNMDSSKLLLQAGLGRYGFTPLLGGLSGPLQVNLDMVGSTDKGYSTALIANASGTALNLQGLYYPARAGEADYQFDLTFGTQDLAPIVTAFGHVIPGLNSVAGDVVPFSVAGQLARTDGQAHTFEISGGQLGGNSIGGRLDFVQGNGQTLVGGKLDLDHFSLPAVLAGVFGIQPEISLSPDGMPWPQAEFSDPLIPFDGAQIRLTATSADLGVGGLAKGFLADMKLGETGFELNEAKADWAGGKLSGEMSLTSGDSLGMRLRLEASELDLQMLAAIHDVPLDIRGSLELSGGFDGLGKTPRAIVGSLGGEGVLSVTGGLVKGIRQQGLASVLKAADAEGFEINAQAVPQLVQAAFLTGETAFSIPATAFTVSRGTMQMRNIVPKTPESPSPSLDLMLNLTDGTGSAVLAMAPEAGLEAQEGASTEFTVKLAGPVVAPELEIATAPLEGFLSLRAFEREQRRVEILQSAVLERQRLRQDLLRSEMRQRHVAAKLEEQRRREEEERERIRLEKEREAERLRQQEAERQRKLEEKRKAEEAARKAAEAAARAEQERLAKEQEAQQRQAKQSRKTQVKEGVEARPLPPPTANDLFKNIEKLFQRNTQ
ncbi:AsmA family protein [Salaquimonas pukyongi]|uniref:AsmA family protein n=1 Tax=Salaquimonas pukyongi TaxID=2712698 RepID=UPI00096BA4BE|nr:AsmA family protein [Salaquimonas pukyongi]